MFKSSLVQLLSTNPNYVTDLRFNVSYTDLTAEDLAEGRFDHIGGRMHFKHDDLADFEVNKHLYLTFFLENSIETKLKPLSVLFKSTSYVLLPGYV